jgi:hypothetical protein
MWCCLTSAPRKDAFPLLLDRLFLSMTFVRVYLKKQVIPKESSLSNYITPLAIHLTKQ